MPFHILQKMTIVLPRQARDKHRESTQTRDDAFSCSNTPSSDNLAALLAAEEAGTGTKKAEEEEKKEEEGTEGGAPDKAAAAETKAETKADDKKKTTEDKKREVEEEEDKKDKVSIPGAVAAYIKRMGPWILISVRKNAFRFIFNKQTSFAKLKTF